MDGSCKAYGESLLHSKKQVEHERLRLAKTVGRLTNSYKGTYKRRQTHRFCSCIDGPLKAPPLTLFHYMRTRPVVKNCIITPSFTFQPRRHSYLLSACAYPLARALIFHEGLGTSGGRMRLGSVLLEIERTISVYLLRLCLVSLPRSSSHDDEQFQRSRGLPTAH